MEAIVISFVVGRRAGGGALVMTTDPRSRM
jgi:hypothetical protein